MTSIVMHKPVNPWFFSNTGYITSGVESTFGPRAILSTPMVYILRSQGLTYTSFGIACIFCTELVPLDDRLIFTSCNKHYNHNTILMLGQGSFGSVDDTIGKLDSELTCTLGLK